MLDIDSNDELTSKFAVFFIQKLINYKYFFI